MDYLVVIEKADGNYSAYVPDLPGCVATGDTAEQAKQRIAEAIDLHIKGLIEDGEPVPPPRAQGATVHTDSSAA